MKDIFKKIIRPLDLRSYAPEMETEIPVWVNPPRSLLAEIDGLALAVVSIRKELEEMAGANPENEAQTRARGKELSRRLEEIGLAQAEIMARLWSQSEDPETHWSVEEVRELVEQASDTDPALWSWMRASTLQMIREYRAGQKKV